MNAPARTFRTLRKTKTLFFLCALAGCVLLALENKIGAATVVHAQQPTGSVPTVTGTAIGPTIRIDTSLKQVRVYAGPSSFDYPAVGVMTGGEVAPALGRARDRDDWIKIYYAGVPKSEAWIYGPYTSLSPGAFLPIIEIPPTQTPASTPTLELTVEAAFIGQPTTTRLPTFTPPPQLELPSFEAAPETRPTGGVPAGMIILILGLFGFFGAVASYLRGR
ncbi:MAG: hypothetical protein HS124_04915 [Anaerolineales bacterium]|nr:hypothetical protein [Anaerolineales bacterium]MCL4260305.1 hypothetical protein [Anaerolineales bacterium]